MNPEFLIDQAWINLAYLAAAVLFILGIKGLTHPRTAVRGNLLGAAGMLAAVLATFLARGLDYRWVLAALTLGTVVGVWSALKVRMTAMPQMVAVLNGFGGAASMLVAGVVQLQSIRTGASPNPEFLIATAASGLIGAVTFWGSLIAFGKLQGLVTEKAILFPGQKTLNALLGTAALTCSAWVVMRPNDPTLYWILCLISSALGVTLVIPIGGADMPVVIALLNSYSGLAAAANGFVLNNNLLIIAGSLVGASGVILTTIMCRAMNRSLVNVLFGVLGPAQGTTPSNDIYAGKIKSTTADELALLLQDAQRVVIIPGYGMAVAQAQHAVKELASTLQSLGCRVEYAIHPVAGRMPGHMNVLLAEADVPYDQLVEMDAVNPTMKSVDVALVIGANDVVNPLARDPTSAIAGMPIIEADHAKTVVVVKRGLSAGFAGIPNPLFIADNTLMYFGDARKAIQDLVAALKES